MKTRMLRIVTALLCIGVVAATALTNFAGADTQIFDGDTATPHEFPMMAQLRRANASNWTSANFCGGVLVDKRWVITAAHCMRGEVASNIEVVLGEHQLSTTNGNEVVMKISAVIEHPNFNYTTVANDIALLYLSSDVPLVANVIEPGTPIVAPATGGSVTATGWGAVDYNGFDSDELQKGTLNVKSWETCRDFVQNLRGRYNLPYTYTGQVCAGSIFAQSCKGDSGSPLLGQMADGRWGVVGLTSFGDPYCQGDMTVYTRVYDYRSWIKSWIAYKANDASTLDMRCYPMNGITACQIQGPLAQVTPLKFTWSSSNSSLRVVYPQYGTMPYVTGNGVIYLGAQSGNQVLACPTGEKITMAVSFYNNYIGAVTRSCP